MSKKPNACANSVLITTAAIGAALVAYAVYKRMKQPAITIVTVPTSPVAPILGALKQESSTLPLRFQFEGAFPDPARQPLLTHHPHHVYPSAKQFVPGKNMWMIRFYVPIEGDQLWQFKLRGRNIAQTFRQAVLFLDNNEIATLDARKRTHYTILQNGDISLHFTNKPFWLRGMDTHRLSVVVYVDGSVEYAPPEHIVLTPIYGVGQAVSKREFGEKWADRLMTADGVPMTIYYGPSGRVRIEHSHYTADARKLGRHTPNEDHPDFRPSMATYFHYAQLGNVA